MTALEEFDGLLTMSGVSLAALEIDDIGLSRSDALRAVEILRHGKLSILGGDAYFRRGDRIKVAHDFWVVEKKPEEHREAYLQRTFEEAETFLNNFPETANAEVLFSIVVDRGKRAAV